MTTPTPLIKDLITEAKKLIDDAIDVLRQARLEAEDIRHGVHVAPYRDEKERMTKLDRRSTLIEFNHAVLKAEKTLRNFLRRNDGRIKRIEEFPFGEFESWNDEGAEDAEIEAKIDEQIIHDRRRK